MPTRRVSEGLPKRSSPVRQQPAKKAPHLTGRRVSSWRICYAASIINQHENGTHAQAWLMTPLAPETPHALFRLWPDYQPTPLLSLPRLAAHCAVAKILLKDEGKRPLGSFKALGGMYAGLRALVRAAGAADIPSLLAARPLPTKLPPLICASDGNHGLAVAAAAEMAGTAARIYLHRGVSPARAKRISDRGAQIVWTDGTYDDAVHAAALAARGGDGLLIADTTQDEFDPVIADVLAGYGLLAAELVVQLQAMQDERPTHLFVQAGVGGLAAAMAAGVREQMSATPHVVVVEPALAACVGAALRFGLVQRISGDLETVASMLSCGEASAPALTILLRHQAQAIQVDEAALLRAAALLANYDGPATTPSGAAGLAGFLSALPGTPLAQELQVDHSSRILLIATEGPLPVTPE